MEVPFYLLDRYSVGRRSEAEIKRENDCEINLLIVYELLIQRTVITATSWRQKWRQRKDMRQQTYEYETSGYAYDDYGDNTESEMVTETGMETETDTEEGHETANT